MKASELGKYLLEISKKERTMKVKLRKIKLIYEIILLKFVLEFLMIICWAGNVNMQKIK